jgi:hypothetical protein
MELMHDIVDESLLTKDIYLRNILPTLPLGKDILKKFGFKMSEVL